MNSESKNESMVRELFEKRIAPDLFKRLLADPGIVDTAGEMRELTVMFADMVNFATLVDSMEPRRLVEYQNDFLAALSKAVLANGGFVDKIIGDEIMALWGTPANPENHAVRACRAAIEIQRAVQAVAEKWVAKGERATRITVGIHSGEAIIANFGPPDHLQYTPMGANINIGARIEGLTREYGVSIAISEDTRAMAGDAIVCREAGRFTPRGRGELVIYELLAMSDEVIEPATRTMIDAYEHGIALLAKGEADEARASFLSALNVAAGDDVPSLRQLERCATIRRY